MSRLVIGEDADPDSRFPLLRLEIGGRRWKISGALGSQIGQAMAEAARSTVSRVDIDVLRPVVFECEIEEITE